MPSTKKKGTKPKIPKGYTDTYTTYELITKTSYTKPYKMLKAMKSKRKGKEKEYAMPVKIVSDTSNRKKKRGR